MFSDADRAFMAENMKIVVESIESKLRESVCSEFASIAADLISKSIDSIIKFEASGVARDLYHFHDNEAEEFINRHFCEIEKTIKNEDVKQMLDALRHSFACYAYNGLHQLYTRQENECWHPKIELTEILQPNDIESLPDYITLYRGCDIVEFEEKAFGQAWTTSLEIARKFAYSHYSNQEWFHKKNRVVLGTKFSKKMCYFQINQRSMKLSSMLLS